MAKTMLAAMLIMTFAFWAYAFAVVFARTRALVLERDRHAQWAGEAARRAPAGPARFTPGASA